MQRAEKMVSLDAERASLRTRYTYAHTARSLYIAHLQNMLGTCSTNLVGVFTGLAALYVSMAPTDRDSLIGNQRRMTKV